MDSLTDAVVLWKAPQPGRNAVAEIQLGFPPEVYAGQGPYFTTELFVALEFEATYRNGLQEIRLPRTLMEEWLEQGVLQEDPYYAPGISFHVPPDKLAVFNQRLRSLVTRFHSSNEIDHG